MPRRVLFNQEALNLIEHRNKLCGIARQQCPRGDLTDPDRQTLRHSLFVKAACRHEIKRKRAGQLSNLFFERHAPNQVFNALRNGQARILVLWRAHGVSLLMMFMTPCWPGRATQTLFTRFSSHSWRPERGFGARLRSSAKSAAFAKVASLPTS